MSPSVATGRLGNDPVVGTPEWTKERQRHEELVARLARLYQVRARIPDAIRDVELRLRDSSMRLGLDDDGLEIVPARRRPRTDTQERTLAALPGRVSAIAAKLNEPASVVGQRLAAYRVRGLCAKDDGYAGVWRRVLPGGET